MKVTVLFILFLDLLLFSCAPDSQEKETFDEEKKDTLNFTAELNKLSRSEGEVSLMGSYTIDIIKENDSTWNAYYFEDPKSFRAFYEKNDGMLMYDVSCFQTCADIVEFDSLFNPLVLYRFENKTTKTGNEKKLVFLSYYVDGREIVKQDVNQTYFLSGSAVKREIEHVIDSIKINELSKIKFSNPDFFKNNTKSWMMIVNDCFGFYNPPMGEIRSSSSPSDQ